MTPIAALLISALATTALIRILALLADLHHVHRAVASRVTPGATRPTSSDQLIPDQPGKTLTDASVAVVGLAIAGIGIGGTFPLACALHVAASPRSADQALGQITTAAGLGQIVGPLAAGALGQAANLRVGLFVLVALVLLAAVTTRRLPTARSRGSQD